MGAASTLFFRSNDPDKQTLSRRITPTEEQSEEQKERWNELADELLAYLKDRSSCPVKKWLQGSYKFGTQIRPVNREDEFDIDLGVYVIWPGTAEDGDFGPVELQAMVQDFLLGYTAHDVIGVTTPPKERCCRIRFEGNFHIDVPTYHLDEERDIRSLATGRGRWEDSDPKALYVWFVRQFEDPLRGKIRRLIRYLKVWVALKFQDGGDRPSSTLLTVLVAEAASNVSTDSLSSDDDALSAVLDEIVSRLDDSRVVPNPATLDDEDLASRLSDQAMDEFLQQLRRFRDVAHYALEFDDVFSAAEKWAEEFEHFFPMPDVEEFLESAGKSALPTYAFVPEIFVTASPRSNPSASFHDTNKIGQVPRDCDIYFEVTNEDRLPPGAVIEWTVRNEGDEAEEKNDLGHKAGRGSYAREHSLYKGTHYMDCVVKQNGRVIGARRVPVSITGIFLPRRNPKNRPNYTNFRKRR